MKTDAAIKRTRDARSSISASVADDPVKLVKYYIAIQKRFDARLQPGPDEAWEDSHLTEQQQRDNPPNDTYVGER
jgi:hypothetical protein